MNDRDPLCGCPVEMLQPNRRDRRTAVRRGAFILPRTVTRHRRGCGRIVGRSDNANDQAQRRAER